MCGKNFSRAVFLLARNGSTGVKICCAKNCGEVLFFSGW